MKECNIFQDLSGFLDFQSLTAPFIRHGWKAVPPAKVPIYFQAVSKVFYETGNIFMIDPKFIGNPASLHRIFDHFFRPGVVSYISSLSLDPEDCGNYLFTKYNIAFSCLYHVTQDDEKSNSNNIKFYDSISGSLGVFYENLKIIREQFSIRPYEKEFVDFLILVILYIFESKGKLTSEGEFTEELSVIITDKFYSGLSGFYDEVLGLKIPTKLEFADIECHFSRFSESQNLVFK